VRFVLHTLNGTSALNALSPASSASLQTSLPLVSDAYGTVSSQPQVVEREGVVGFEWLVSWKPPRLSLQRLQCVCFMASVDVGVPDNSPHHVVAMSLPHCITFIIVPDPPPSWSQSALGLLPLRIVMGTLVTIQIQATDDNPDDIIVLQSLTLPANIPSFVKIVPGTCTSVCHLSHRPDYDDIAILSPAFPDGNSLAPLSSSQITSAPPTLPSWRPIPVVSARIAFSPQLEDGGQNITLCFKAVDSAGQAARGPVSLVQMGMDAGLCVQVMVVSCIYRSELSGVLI
jgi:hypothetical protein